MAKTKHDVNDRAVLGRQSCPTRHSPSNVLCIPVFGIANQRTDALLELAEEWDRPLHSDFTDPSCNTADARAVNKKFTLE